MTDENLPDEIVRRLGERIDALRVEVARLAAHRTQRTETMEEGEREVTITLREEQWAKIANAVCVARDEGSGDDLELNVLAWTLDVAIYGDDSEYGLGPCYHESNCSEDVVRKWVQNGKPMVACERHAVEMGWKP